MFKKENRLSKQKDFDRVFKQGKSSFDKILGVKICSNDLNINRFAVVVSNKVSKKAVKRNRIKRQIREIVKLYSQDWSGGKDVLIIALPTAVNMDFSDFKQSLDYHFKRLKLLST